MPAPGRQRVDKWLFFARVVKSRALAAKLVTLGRVRINREKAEAPADAVKPGDVLTVNLDRQILVLKVLGPGERRGPAPEARTLYEDLSPQEQAVGRPRPLEGAEPLRRATVASRSGES